MGIYVQWNCKNKAFFTLYKQKLFRTLFHQFWIPNSKIWSNQTWYILFYLRSCTFFLFFRPGLHTVSFDWFLSGLEWILKLEFCLIKLLIFYQKLLWNIRSRLNSSTFWVFRPVFRYVWSELKLFTPKMKILIKYI